MSHNETITTKFTYPTVINSHTVKQVAVQLGFCYSYKIQTSTVYVYTYMYICQKNHNQLSYSVVLPQTLFLLHVSIISWCFWLYFLFLTLLLSIYLLFLYLLFYFLHLFPPLLTFLSLSIYQLKLWKTREKVIHTHTHNQTQHKMHKYR